VAPSDGQRVFAVLNSVLGDNPANTAIVGSSDGGSTWTVLLESGEVLQYLGIVVSPTDPGTVYVGAGSTDGRALVWKSSDAGKSWRQVIHGLFGGGSAVALVIDPLDEKTLYLATGSNGVFKTISGGE
jgi:photosystem II stability/assembly factor-like uncharacterized protein